MASRYPAPSGGAVGQLYQWAQALHRELVKEANSRTASIAFLIDGAGATVTTGVKGDVQVEYGCTIQAVRLLADQTGSIQVDIWKDSYANYPPTNADSITASAVPAISSSNKDEDTTLTGWTTAIAAGDILRFNVDSATTITRCTVVLDVVKTFG